MCVLLSWCPSLFFEPARVCRGVVSFYKCRPRMFFRWGGADGAHGGQLRPREKTEPLPGRGLRPGVRRWGGGGQGMRPSRWRAERTLTAAGSANRWGRMPGCGPGPSPAEGASRWLSRGAGIREASMAWGGQGRSPRGSGTDRVGAFPAEREWEGRRGAVAAGELLGRIAREARDDPAELRDGAIPASGIRRVRSSPASCRTERERSPEQPGPTGHGPEGDALLDQFPAFGEP
jgi:hypothetical protein